MRNEAFSRRSRAKTGEKCTKKCDARAKLRFCKLNLLFFWRSRCRPRRWILKSLLGELSLGRPKAGRLIEVKFPILFYNY